MLSPEWCNSHDVGAINDTLSVLPSVLPLMLVLYTFVLMNHGVIPDKSGSSFPYPRPPASLLPSANDPVVSSWLLPSSHHRYQTFLDHNIPHHVTIERPTSSS